MAFNIFKKKQDFDYPEEKASVLDQTFESGPEPGFIEPQDISPEPGMGELPPPPAPRTMPAPQTQVQNFSAGFVPLERMAPSELPVMPSMESSMSASLRSPEEHRPALFERETVMPSQSRFATEKPHVFIRVNKYKEVMGSVNELHRKIEDAKKDLEDMHELNSEETHKLKEAAEVLLKIEDILRYLETTFASPEA